MSRLPHVGISFPHRFLPEVVSFILCIHDYLYFHVWCGFLIWTAVYKDRCLVAVLEYNKIVAFRHHFFFLNSKSWCVILEVAWRQKNQQMYCPDLKDTQTCERDTVSQQSSLRLFASLKVCCLFADDCCSCIALLLCGFFYRETKG